MKNQPEPTPVVPIKQFLAVVFIGIALLFFFSSESPQPANPQLESSSDIAAATDADALALAAGAPKIGPMPGDAVSTSSPLETITVSASKLVRAYDDNELAAQNQYGGRMLRVTGRNAGVKLDSDDQPTMHFEVADTLLGVRIDFAPGGTTGMEGLKTGKNATVECTDVTEVMGVPSLKGCILQP